MQYAFTSLARYMFTLDSIADEIAHSEIRIRVAYAYNLKFVRMLVWDTMQAYNDELESYLHPAIEAYRTFANKNQMKGQYHSE